MNPAVFAPVVIVLIGLTLQPVAPAGCSRCGWKPPGGPIVQVRNIGELERAVESARPGETILLASGTYALRPTRAGDVWDAVQAGEHTHDGGGCGDSCGTGSGAAAGPVGLGIPTLRPVQS